MWTDSSSNHLIFEEKWVHIEISDFCRLWYIDESWQKYSLSIFYESRGEIWVDGNLFSGENCDYSSTVEGLI